MLPNLHVNFLPRRNHFTRFCVYRPNGFFGNGLQKLSVPIDLKGDLYNS